MWSAAKLLRNATAGCAAAATLVIASAHRFPVLADGTERALLSSLAAAPAPSAAADQQQQQQAHAQRKSTRPQRLQEGVHFAVLTREGAPARLSSIAHAMDKADVVLLGEYHDDPVAHALQLELLKRATSHLNTQQPQEKPQEDPQQQQQRQRQVVLSLEMFERDAQPVVDEYLAGSIRLTDLMRDARAWPNFATDYQPLLEHAKKLQLPVLAANAPRRYVSLVGRSSKAALQQLPAAAMAWLPPLPYPGPSAAYAHKVESGMQEAAQEMQRLKQQQQQQRSTEPAAEPSSDAATAVGHQQQQQQQQGMQQQDSGPAAAAAAQKVLPPQQSAPPPPAPMDGPGCPYIGFSVSSNFLDAQALWDASMAHAIAGALATVDDEQRPLVVHICGKFHCESRLGIPEQLQGYVSRPCAVLVVVFVPAALQSGGVTAEDLRAAGLLGAADFVVLTDGSLPRSFASQHPD